MPQEFELTRTFDAPRELVFKAWTEPERLNQWWGPKIFTRQHAQSSMQQGFTGTLDQRAAYLGKSSI